MSLLEDIFLQDEADEAQELERVIEGDEYDERPRSRSGSPNSDGNEPKDDEAEEEKRRVDPSSTKTKRVTKNPRFLLNPARLTGPRGIQIIPNHFKDFKFKGKGHEKEDLDMVLKKLEHWAYRLYPKFQFEDCLKKIESLGKKRPVMVHLQKIRTDQYISEETVVQKDSSDDETQPPQEQDEFDKLLQQQIDLARATPAPGSVKKIMDTPKKDRSPFTMPKATSSPSISDDQKERMIRNRKLAEERRLARLKQSSLVATGKQDSVIIEVDEEMETNVTAKKNNRSYVIDSSDDECDVTSVNQSVAVDVHNGTKKAEESNVVDKVVQEAGGNPHDIEMDKNFDNNVAVPVIEDVVKVIDDVDKGRNVRETEQTDTISSDDECDVTSVNQSLAVDVYNGTKKGEESNEDDKVAKEAGGNNPDDIEMDENDAVQVTEDIVEVINDVDKGNVRQTKQTDTVIDEIIEINDPTDKIIKRHQTNQVANEVIEINDENHQETQIIEIYDETVKGKDIGINDHVIEIMDDVTHKENKISNKTAVLKENDNNTSTVEVHNNNTIPENKSSTNNACIQKEQDKIKEIQDGAKDSDLKKSSGSMAEEVIEDIMDVDFSDDF